MEMAKLYNSILLFNNSLIIFFRESQDKQWIKRLLKRIHSPQVLSLLCAFLVTYYNSINEDASLEIQCELPMVPLTVNKQKMSFYFRASKLAYSNEITVFCK